MNFTKSFSFFICVISVLLCEEFCISKDRAGHNIFDEEISIKCNDSGIVLAGTLSKPHKEGKFPCVILIWGNGPHTRDQVISETPMFAQISRHFNHEGYAVVRIDKRGFGKSTGPKAPSETVTTTMDLVNDIKATFNFLKNRKDIDITNSGLLGHSEGALIASILASEEPGIKWLILMAPPGAKCKDIFLYQVRENAKNLGMDPKIIEELQNVWERYSEFIKNDFTNDSIYYEIGHEFLRVQGVKDEDNTKNFVNMVIDGYRNKWHQVFFRIDPYDYLKNIKIPVLALFGESDSQVVPEMNIPPIISALKYAGNKKFRIEVLPDNDHYFLQYNGQLLDEHKAGKMKISKFMLEKISEWLNTK